MIYNPLMPPQEGIWGKFFPFCRRERRRRTQSESLGGLAPVQPCALSPPESLLGAKRQLQRALSPSSFISQQTYISIFLLGKLRARGWGAHPRTTKLGRSRIGIQAWSCLQSFTIPLPFRPAQTRRPANPRVSGSLSSFTAGTRIPPLREAVKMK